MMGLRTVIILMVLLALALVVVGDKHKRVHARDTHGGGHGGGHQMPCTNDPNLYQYFPPCSTTTQSTSTTTESSTTTDSSTTTESITTTTTDDVSEVTSGNTTTSTTLQRAHWCRFSNGTYLPLSASYMHTPCTFCQCTQSRAIRCQSLQCMPTYCIDNTMPSRQPGQCCTQCAYEKTTNSCLYNGIGFPHGTIMKMVDDKMQCWCQLGNIECRNYMGSLFQGLDVLGDGTAVYIIVIVLIVVVIFGLLLCCGCTFAFYFYYKKNQHTIQEAYDQYVNSAGWEPMDESEENVVDASAEEKRLEAEEKRLEAEGYQYSNSTADAVPPPYAGYNGAYVSEQEQKQM